MSEFWYKQPGNTKDVYQHFWKVQSLWANHNLRYQSLCRLIFYTNVDVTNHRYSNVRKCRKCERLLSKRIAKELRGK